MMGTCEECRVRKAWSNIPVIRNGVVISYTEVCTPCYVKWARESLDFQNISICDLQQFDLPFDC